MFSSPFKLQGHPYTRHDLFTVDAPSSLFFVFATVRSYGSVGHHVSFLKVK